MNFTSDYKSSRGDKEHIKLIVRSLNQDFRPNTIRVPLTTGETFFANGHVQRIPRGEVDAQFVPKRGTINNTVVTPPVPARVALQSFRVPKGVGAMLAFDYLEFLVNLKESQALFNVIDQLAADQLRRTAYHDLDLIGDTLTAVQVQPEECAQRLRAGALTKTARKTGQKTTRIRGFSRT